MAPRKTAQAEPADTTPAPTPALAVTVPAVTVLPRRDERAALWAELKRTDPSATQPFKKAGGFSGTQIDPVWRLQRMTEQFGPVGLGWGYDIMDRWREDFTIRDRNGVASDKTSVFVQVRLWYVDEQTGERCYTGPQIGGTEVERATDEVYKMAVTDGIGKCMLQLGLAADIYLGLFDDSKYREESAAYFEAKANPHLQPAAIKKLERELKERVAATDTAEALDDLWRGGAGARIREIGGVDKAAQERLTHLFTAHKQNLLAELEAKEWEAGPSTPPSAAPPPPSADADGWHAFARGVQEILRRADFDGPDALENYWRRVRDRVAELPGVGEVYRTREGVPVEGAALHDAIVALYGRAEECLLPAAFEITVPEGIDGVPAGRRKYPNSAVGADELAHDLLRLAQRPGGHAMAGAISKGMGKRVWNDYPAVQAVLREFSERTKAPASA